MDENSDMLDKRKNDFFSVVIPTYNRAHLVKRAIKSVLLQTYPEFEIIIVDDCSTDDTRKIIREIKKKDERIRYIRLNENRGGAAARNVGVEVSRGELIGFLDSDDEVLPKWLEKSNKKIATLPSSWGVLYPKYGIKDDLTGVVYHNAIKQKEGYIYENFMKGEGLHILTPGSIVKKSAFKEVGGFDERLLGFHDYDLWYKLAKKWTFHFLNISLLLIHNHQNFRLTDENERRKQAQRIFHEKWRDEIERISGKKAVEKRILRRSAGLLINSIRSEMIKNGRMASVSLFFRDFSWKNFKFYYLLKTIYLIVVGPKAYDILRRWQGNLYWKFKK